MDSASKITHPSPPRHVRKGIVNRLIYVGRDLLAWRMFPALRKYCHGNVLDVGGFDFFRTAVKRGIPFTSWTTIDPSHETLPEIRDPRFRLLDGDGCSMEQVESNTFDTVINLQVLEHVFEPMKMVQEIQRVLKPGGHAIFLIPQTNTLHLAPYHYYNFTRYWILEAMQRANLEIVSLQALGGRWCSSASNLVYFLPQSLGSSGMRVHEERRPILFYLLYPFMVATVIALVPLFLLLSLGDVKEEANNHLVIVRKR